MDHAMASVQTHNKQQQRQLALLPPPLIRDQTLLFSSRYE
jgi:hypothetical protein